MSIPIINKESIDTLSFAKGDVLSNEQDVQLRTRRLQKALKLGNTYKSHVRLVFKTSDGGIMKTVVTVWAVTEKYVVLKGQRMIPIEAIIEVELVA